MVDRVLMKQRQAPNERTNWERFQRLVRYRLGIPLLRSQHTPEHTARGVAVGMVWAMTPFFGLQMAMTFVTWTLARYLFGWNFSLIAGLAWTWTTNAFTVLPAFYLFYVTGQVMLGRFDDITGYHAFGDVWQASMADGQSFWGSIVDLSTQLVSDMGWPLLIGSIPWAIVSGFVAFYLSLAFIQRYRDRRVRRLKARAAADRRD